MLQSHQQTKEIILEKLRRLAQFAQKVGMDSLARDIHHGRIPKLENERFHLVILGEFNHGKSTFVNALLGESVLPTGITPTTAALNHISYAESPRAKALTNEGQEISLSPSEVADWVTVQGSRRGDVDRVEIGYPAELLKGNITLVDTPGVNDLNEQRADITYGYVPRADAVLFLLDASQALKDSEREFLASHVLEGSKNRLIFVLGKMDLLSPPEQKAVLDYVRTGLRKFVDAPVVFPLSAKQWLDDKDDDSGMPELLSYMEGFLDTDRASIVLDNAAVDAERTAALVQQNYGIKLHALGLDMKDLEGRVEEVRKQLLASKRQIDDLHQKIKSDVEAVKSSVQLSLTDFTQRFAKAIVHEIDRVEANDLKQYLGPFVQDKFKEWSELQGLQVSRALEKLAEEVITITNENVADAFNALSSRLGPNETEVQIDTDSFMYDVGIYAVGALGTTVFLFVNSLAGGLLTLAAPILAIVLKSKVAGDIKEQAKERAPTVILDAGKAMGPYFNECIDDFAKRLRDFVTGAGVNLYKGINEVLENTVAERKSASDSIAPLVASCRESSIEVAKLREELRTIRDGIWEGKRPLAAGAMLEDLQAALKPQVTPPPLPHSQGSERSSAEATIPSESAAPDDDDDDLPENETRKDLN